MKEKLKDFFKENGHAFKMIGIIIAMALILPKLTQSV
jgi:predicted negative regulator of RcsB-dependent stress response